MWAAENRIYLMTLVDRSPRCILSWRVVTARTGAVIREMLHESVLGQTYFSDAFEAYQTALFWPAEHHAMSDKSETYSAEGYNAKLRHYLAKLFVYAFNRRQLACRRFPAYPHHVIDFVCP